MNDAVNLSPIAPDTTKDSLEFGKRLLISAYEKWTNGTTEGASGRRNRYDYNRLFAMGKQPMQEYKDILDLDGDMSMINLDYSPTPIAIPFVNRLIDRYMQRIEKIQANAIDPFTQSKKDKAKMDALFKMKNKEKIQAIQQESGLELEEFSDDDPKDEREIDIHFGFNYKEREEVILEQGIDLIFYDNNWDKIIKKRILYDLITAGIAQTYTYLDGNGKIKIGVTKPENIVSSYSEWDDFRDATYKGGVNLMKISEIRMKYPKAVTRLGGEEKLFELAISNKGLNGNDTNFGWGWTPEYNQAIDRPYDGFSVEVIQLSFKAVNNLKYQVNTDRFGKEVLDRKEKLNPEKPNIQSPPYEVEYVGVMLTKSQFVLEWGLAKNQVKNDKNLLEVTLPYVTHMYGNNKMVNTPLIETMIPSIKMMQLVQLQQQKIIAAAAPDGYMVDISQMSDITLGEGMESVSPFELYKIYKQTGIQYYKRVSDEGINSRDNQPPITPANVPFSAKLEQLMGVWNAEYDKLQKIIGDNNLAAGNITNQAVGNKTLQDAKQIGESASNYIYDAFLDIDERTAKIAGQRLWDILVHKKKGERYYDGYRMALGSERIEYIRLEATDDFEKCNFDVKIQAVIDDKEAQYLEQNIQVALSQKEITLEDAIDVRLLAKNNLKYASYMLSSRMKKRLKEAQEQASRASQENTQAAVAAAQEKGTQDKELEVLKAQLKSQGVVEETEALKENELVKYTSILKVELMKSILSKEGSSMKDLPGFIFEGVGLIDISNKQILMEQIRQEQEDQQAEQQQMEQQQMATQEGQLPQGEAMGQPMQEEAPEQPQMVA